MNNTCKKLRNKERKVDALAIGADEGRDEQRYASGSSKYAEIRRFPNGETHHVEDMVSSNGGKTQRTETS